MELGGAAVVGLTPNHKFDMDFSGAAVVGLTPNHKFQIWRFVVPQL
jgi:hypothetical protein